MHRRSALKATLTFSALGLLGQRSHAKAGPARIPPPAGFAMPLESVPHTRTFMQWPAFKSIYGSQEDLDAVREKIALIANSIGQYEPVVLLAREDQMEKAEKHLSEDVEIWSMPVQDLWCRDSGPTFVRNPAGELAVTEFNFNGWGNKQPHRDDALISARVAAKLGLKVYDAGVVGEAGGVETDGAGTLMAHESSWINPNRNKGSKAEIEALLLAATGAKKIIWAPGVKGADITDYHIDALARFVKPGQVLLQLPETIIAGDPWSKAAFETYEILKKSTDAHGRRLEVVVVPEPENPRIRQDDFVASYVNYYVCNGAVISAEFGDDTADAEAERILGQLYPGRDVVSLNVDAIGQSGGGIHCATQQQPKGA